MFLERVTQDNNNLSSLSSQDSNPRIRTITIQDKSGMSSWAVGGTPRQRRVQSSLGRRTRDMDNHSSDTSQDPNSRHQRLRVEYLSVEVLSSLPSTVRPQSSPSMDVPDGSSDSRRGRKFWKRDYIPVRNIMVFDTTKLFLQGEVIACHPWPNTATIENMISRTWIRAIETRQSERLEIYEGSRYASAVNGPTKEPFEISREITSELYITKNSVSLTFLAQTSNNCMPRVFCS
jgi:hypothetical protein